jgi:hypothetical protein
MVSKNAKAKPKSKTSPEANVAVDKVFDDSDFNVILSGSQEHSECIAISKESANWPDAFQHPDFKDVPQLTEHAWNTHDVVISTKVFYRVVADTKLERAKKAEYTAHPDRWYEEHLRGVLGHKVLRRSSIVLDATRRTIVALCTIGLPSGMTRGMHRVSDILVKAFGKNVRHGTMTSVGQKSCLHNDAANDTLYGAYYPTKKETFNFNTRQERLVTNLLKGFCRNEEARAPVMAAWRLREARQMELGGCPFIGVPLEDVSCAAFTFTEGYAKVLHADEDDESTVEGIFYDASRMPAGHLWGFSLFEFGLIFDLSAAVSTALIIPSHLLHGTVGCPGQDDRDAMHVLGPAPHPGMGMAILNKKNMLKGQVPEKHWPEYMNTVGICKGIMEGRRIAERKGNLSEKQWEEYEKIMGRCKSGTEGRKKVVDLGIQLWRNVGFKKATFRNKSVRMKVEA